MKVFRKSKTSKSKRAGGEKAAVQKKIRKQESFQWGKKKTKKLQVQTDPRNAREKMRHKNDPGPREKPQRRVLKTKKRRAQKSYKCRRRNQRRLQKKERKAGTATNEAQAIGLVSNNQQETVCRKKGVKEAGDGDALCRTNAKKKKQRSTDLAHITNFGAGGYIHRRYHVGGKS